MEKEQFTLDIAIRNFKNNADREKKNGNKLAYHCNLKLVEWLIDYKKLLEKQTLEIN